MTRKWRRFVPITKIDVEKRLVSGIGAEELPDKGGEIMDYASSKPHFEEWSGSIEKATAGKSKGNVRAMHGKIAAGKLTAIEFDDAAREIPVVAKIVDDQEWDKCLEGVYTGFSIGGEYGRTWADPADPGLKRYTAIPSEISIVDNPAMYGTHFEVHKSGGAVMRKIFTGARPYQVQDEFLEKLRGDGTLKKDDRPGVVKMIEDALASANEAITWARNLAAELALLEGDPDTWAMGDVLAAIEALVYAKESVEYKAAEAAAEAIETQVVADTGSQPPGTAPAGEGGMSMSRKPGRLGKMIGQNVKKQREENGMSELELAGKVAGATEDTIKAIEGGEAEPTIEVLSQLAQAFGCGMEELTAIEGEEEPATKAEEDPPAEETEAEKAARVKELKKAAVDGDLKKIAEAVLAQSEAVRALQKGIESTVEKAVETRLEKATADLRTTVEEMGKTLEKVAATPAAIGREVKPAEKALGHKDQAEVIDLGKMREDVDALAEAGKLAGEPLRQVRRAMAVAAMPPATG